VIRVPAFTVRTVGAKVKLSIVTTATPGADCGSEA